MRICFQLALTFSVEELRHQISKQVERARKTSVNFRLAERYGLIEITEAPVVFYFEKIKDGPRAL